MDEVIRKMAQIGDAETDFPRIPFSSVMRHCAGFIGQHRALDEVLRTSLIHRSFGDDRDQVTFEQFGLLILTTARAADDDSSGLGGKRIAAGTGALAAHIMMGCSTLEHALAAASRLYTSTPIRFAVTFHRDEALIAVRAQENTADELAPALEELFTIFLFGLISYFLGQLLPVLAFQTRDPLHPNLHGRHWASFSPVRLADPAGLRIPRGLLAARRVGEGCDHVYWAMIEPWLSRARMDASAADARIVSLEGLRVDVLAAQAGVSPSTLRRRMARSQGGFRIVRQKLVVEASLQLLRNSSHTTEAIAAELGYADARSFRRFIKAATGTTPEVLRAGRALAPPSVALVRERIKSTALSMSVSPNLSPSWPPV
jgi:AraC-like DNA-binding protein